MRLQALVVIGRMAPQCGEVPTASVFADWSAKFVGAAVNLYHFHSVAIFIYVFTPFLPMGVAKKGEIEGNVFVWFFCGFFVFFCFL